MNIKSFVSLPPLHTSEGVIVNPPLPPLGGFTFIQMALEKEFRDFLIGKGRLPDEIKGEAYELFYMGFDISEIDSVIKSRTG